MLNAWLPLSVFFLPNVFWTFSLLILQQLIDHNYYGSDYDVRIEYDIYLVS